METFSFLQNNQIILFYFHLKNCIEVSMQTLFDQATCRGAVEGQGSFQHASSAVKHKCHLFCGQWWTLRSPLCPHSQAEKAVRKLA